MNQATLDAIRAQTLQAMWEQYRDACIVGAPTMTADELVTAQEHFMGGAVGVLTLFDAMGKNPSKRLAREVLERLKGEASVFADIIMARHTARQQPTPEGQQ